MTSDARTRAEIYELQTMLRRIATVEGWKPVLNPDGLFGKETAQAVRVFQESRGLSVTGVVDLATWEAVYSAYQYALYLSSEGAALLPFPDKKYQTALGERSDLVVMIQLVLAALAIAYDQLEPTAPTGGIDDNY